MIANQYGVSFKVFVEEKYKQSIECVLFKFAQDGLTYKMVANITGFKVTTVRKYTRRYKLSLANSMTQVATQRNFLTEIKKNEIDSINFLYKAWC
ncbi:MULTISPECIES: hypothetical protein [Cysteiniphilum]|uniref:hypothetical protein n=1 Tax=Cysteiniphilum TaxID=2056696 RepID=UPI00178572DD|nr:MULTISPECIES: hypothetical protein [Cysteiniphilum]